MNTDKVKRVLAYLEENNKRVTDVEFNKTWINPPSKEKEEITDKSDVNEHNLDKCQDICFDEQDKTENEDNSRIEGFIRNILNYTEYNP